jgi:hypothetical protein
MRFAFSLHKDFFSHAAAKRDLTAIDFNEQRPTQRRSAQKVKTIPHMQTILHQLGAQTAALHI